MADDCSKFARLPRRALLRSAASIVAGFVLRPSPRVRAAQLFLDTEPLPGALEAAIREVMESAHIPGLSLAIIQKGKVTHSTAYGWADIEQRRPMRPDTLINLGSVTKTLTCTGLMQLWERQKVALDADVNEYVSFRVRNPAFPQVPITIRQLLTHTSSIKDGPAYLQSYACGDPSHNLGEWLRAEVSTDGEASEVRRNYHSWQPGARWAYSNIGYGLLGHVIEQAANQAYADYIVQHVFAPLGMKHSRYMLAHMDRTAHATPYTYVTNGQYESVPVRDPNWKPPAPPATSFQVPHCLYSFATPPDGAARSSAEEMARFLMAIINGGELDGQRVLQSSTVALVLSDQHVHFEPGSKPEDRQQGLTWFRFTDLVPGGAPWGHSGGDPGIATVIACDPREGTGVVVLANGDNWEGVRSVAGRVWPRQ